MSDIVFVDSRVTDATALIDQLTNQGMEIHILEAGSDGVEQMAAFLSERTGVDAIHILSHGYAGAMQLGSSTFDEAGIASHGAALATIGASMAEGGDLLLYGSDVASGDEGASFIDALAMATGVDVAASDDTTGGDGNWTLEASSGDIEAAAIDGSEAAMAALDSGGDAGYAGDDEGDGDIPPDLGDDGDGDGDPEDDAGDGGDDDDNAEDGGDHLDDFTGGDDGDEWEGGEGDDQLDGGGGDDHLEGRHGNDHIVGGHGRDIASYFHAGGRVSVHLATGQAEDDGDGGVDTLDGIEDLRGSVFDDDLGGDEGDNELDGDEGDDELEGGHGNDHLVGGVGHDRASYRHAGHHVVADLAHGEASDGDGGTDTFDGIEDLYGSAYDDELAGNDDSNTLEGDDGSDELEGREGDDTLDGGDGIDTASFVAAMGAVSASLVSDEASDGDGGTDTLANIENLHGGHHNDSLTGDGGDNELDGDLGNDTLRGGSGEDDLRGGAGTDKLEGGKGDDRLDGGDGGDTMAGGTGDDTYVVNSSGDVVTETSALGSEIDAVLASVTFRLGDHLEHLTLTGKGSINGSGNGEANEIHGNGGDNVLDGGGGADSLSGGAGDDTYIVDNANDVVTETSTKAGEIDTVKAGVSFTLGANLEHLLLSGGAAIDGTGNALANLLEGNGAINRLSGGKGDDTLDGGGGKDVLTGGKGHDTFLFDSTPSGRTNVDKIVDFSSVDDRFALDNADFTKLGTAGALKSGAFYAGHAAHDSSDRIIYDEGKGQLLYDADGNGSGAAVLFATVDAHTVVTAADIWVV